MAIPATHQWYTEEKGCKREQRYWRFSLLQKRAKKEILILPLLSSLIQTMTYLKETCTEISCFGQHQN